MRDLKNILIIVLIFLLPLAILSFLGVDLEANGDVDTKPFIEVVKDWGKEPFLSGLSSLTRVFCPVCQEKGMTSLVYVGGTSGTLMYSQPYYDEEGKYHYDDPNTYTTTYSCSIGHEWCESRCGKESWIRITKDTEGRTDLISEEEGEILFECLDVEADDDNLLTLAPLTSFTFGENGKYGKLSWEEGILEFEGNAFESAKTFFLYVLKPMIDEYIEYELEKEELTIEIPEVDLIVITAEGFDVKPTPDAFIKTRGFDPSNYIKDNRLKLDIEGEIYWIKIIPDDWKPLPLDVVW